MGLTAIIDRMLGINNTPLSQKEDYRKQIDDAYRDPVSKAYNMNYLRKQMIIYKSSKTKVLMLSFDNLEELNRTYGNIKSGKLLKATVQLLSSCPGKNTVSRYDTDRFVLITELPNGGLEDFLKMMEKKFANYNRQLPEVPIRLTIAKTALSKKETLKEAMQKLEKISIEEQARKNPRRIVPKIVALLDRRGEQGLYLKYLLGQMPIANPSDIKILFDPLDYETRERIEKQKKIIQRSGLDVRIFLSYDEFASFCRKNLVDSAILYKLKEGNGTLAELLQSLQSGYQKEKPKTSYLIPQSQNARKDEKALIERMKKMNLPGASFPESPDLETLLQHIKHMPARKANY